MEYVDKKNEWIESERKNGSRKKLRKTGGLSGSKASKKNKSFDNFHNILAQTGLHRKQNLHNIRSGGCPGVSENHH